MCESNDIDQKALAKNNNVARHSGHPTLSEPLACSVPSIPEFAAPKRARSGCHSQNTRHVASSIIGSDCVLRVRASKKF
jgi:hypothetical protein